MVAEAKTGREAVQLVLHYRPDVVVMDVVMPELDGDPRHAPNPQGQPRAAVVVLTGGGEHELGLLALRAGAVGFLSKQANIDALPRALEGVRRGEAAISRDMTRRLIDRYRGTTDGATARDRSEPLNLARMGGHRSSQARPLHRPSCRHACALPRNGAFPRQEHHAKTRRPLARRRRRRCGAPADHHSRPGELIGTDSKAEASGPRRRRFANAASRAKRHSTARTGRRFAFAHSERGLVMTDGLASYAPRMRGRQRAAWRLSG